LQSKFFETDASVIVSARACLEPLGEHGPIMPVFSSGQWGGQAPDTFRGVGSDDVIYLAGGGILGHPHGPAAGVQALCQAWEAAKFGIAIEDFAATHPALAASIRKFGDLRAHRGADYE
jgi:ribulose-bisphosphate carboxylase large chain